MMRIACIGLDLAKNVFEVHGVNEHGKPILRKTLSRTATRPWAAYPRKKHVFPRMPLITMRSELVSDNLT